MSSLLVFKIWESRLGITFWISEVVLGRVGIMIYLSFSFWILVRSYALSIKEYAV